MTLERILSQEGLLIVQLLFFAFVAIIALVFFILWARGKKQALLELRRTAKALADQTAEVAANLREETDRRATALREHTEQMAQQVRLETSAELETKINILLQRFDEVKVRQEAVKAVVEKTQEVIQRQLVEDDDHTMRRVVDETHQITEDIAGHIKNGDHKNGETK